MAFDHTKTHVAEERIFGYQVFYITSEIAWEAEYANHYAWCPDVPNVMGYGITLEYALNDLRRLLELAIDSDVKQPGCDWLTAPKMILKRKILE